MPHEEPVDVIILGAGPVGLLLAVALTGLGVTVRVVERGASTKHDPRAAIVWPRVAEVLASVGLVDRFEAEACRLRRARFEVNGRDCGVMALGGLACANPFPLMIEQHATERLLAARLAELGVEVAWNTEAEDVLVGDDGVEVRARRGDEVVTLRGRWVAGCEGARSLVRSRMGIAFEGAPRPNLVCLQGNLRPRWPHPDDRETGYFFIVPGTTLLACPLPTGGYRFVCFTTDDDPSRRGEPDVEEMRAVVARATGLDDVAVEAVEPRWFNRARFQDRVAATLVKGRALLAGDAAHVWAPIGGHGMNAGLRGAHNLAWKLAAVVRGEAPAALLETYSDEQRAAARAVIEGITRMKTEEPSAPWLVEGIARLLPLGLRHVSRFPPVELRLTELDQHHRASPLSRSLTELTPLRAGDRLPDRELVVDGAAVRAHALLSLRRWTLLALHDDIGRAASLRALASRYRAAVEVVSARAEDVASRRELGGRPTAILVRPDGHVGLTAQLDDTQGVAAYLDAWLTRA